MIMLGTLLRQRILGISARETTFEARGFRGATEAMRRRLERVGSEFVGGYEEALRDPDPERLGKALARVEPAWRGFAFEGAAMALALLDRLTPWNRSRIRRFLAGPGDPHAYMVHVAMGWVIGKLGGNVGAIRRSLDPLLGWLAVEGYGFHEGFFKWPRYIPAGPWPARLEGYERNVFDQGLGRSLWFVEGGNVEGILGTMARFPTHRQSDLWSGLGLSCTYAGELDTEGLRRLKEGAGALSPSLAQGAAFAAKARQRAGNTTRYTERACRHLCGLSADEAAQVTDEALENLPADGVEPGFEVWRRRIQFRLRSCAQLAT